MRVMDLGQRPTSIGDLQAASAVGQGKLYRVYDELLRERGVTSAQVLLTFFDMSARTHYLNARQTLTTLLDWRVLPVINENDTTATDEISFGDNDFLAAQVAVLVGAERAGPADRHRRPLHGRPAPRIPTPGSSPRSTTSRRCATWRSATPPRRSARAGCARRSSPPRWRRRRGSPTVICNGLRPGALTAVLAGEREGTRFPAGEARYSQLQAVAEVRQALARHAGGRRRRRARRARGQREPAAGRRRRGARRVRRRRRGGDHRARRRRAPHALAKGICNYSAAELRQVIGPEVRAPCASSCRAPPRRPCTATTSCSTESAGYSLRMAVAVKSVERDLPRGARAPRARSRAPPTGVKDAALAAIAAALAERAAEILEANERDMQAGREADIGDALLDRLRARRGRASRAIAGAVRADRGAARPGRRGDRRRGACPTASTCARCACRSASSRSSTRRARTSRSTPPRCA